MKEAAPLALAGLLFCEVAAAEPVLRPGVHGMAVISDDADVQVAGGGKASFAGGYNLELEPLVLVPEASIDFGGFGGDFDGLAFRAAGGLRVGLSYGLPFEPSAFLRGGYAHQTTFVNVGSLSDNVGLNGGTIQFGLAADFRLSRELTVGPALIYDAALFDVPGPLGVCAVHTVSLGATFAFWLQ